MGSFQSLLCVCAKLLSAKLLCLTVTVACQALLSMGFSRYECWSGLPCPHSGHLSDPGIKCMSLMSPALADGFFTTRMTWETSVITI